jgi:hypothetical protein
MEIDFVNVRVPIANVLLGTSTTSHCCVCMCVCVRVLYLRRAVSEQ